MAGVAYIAVMALKETDMKKLENKVALVTGGSRGIGKAIVYALAQEGANIGLNYLTSEEQAEQNVKNICKNYGIKAIAIKADVSAAVEVRKMVDTMLEEFGHIDILVNNAGVACKKALSDTSLEEWSKVIGTDLTGVFLCTQSVLPSMLSRRWGRIINIASTLGFIGCAGNSAYSAAKGGVLAFTKSVAREFVQQGILVNCVAPGPTETDLFANWPPEIKKKHESEIPLGRLSSPEEVARTVVFLASPDSNVYVGQTLCPSGGEFMI